MIEDDIKRLEEKIDNLNRKLEIIAKIINDLSTPQQPSDINPWRRVIDPPWKPSLTCSKCGLDVSGVLNYCCQDQECPCGLGPITC